MRHTPEPWIECVTMQGSLVSGADEAVVFGTIAAIKKTAPPPNSPEVRSANLARICACVNALQGIEDPEAAIRAAREALAAIDSMPVEGVTPFAIENFLRQAKTRAYDALALLKGAPS